MRFTSDAQRRAVFALYRKGKMLYSDVYPDVAVKTNLPASVFESQLTELRDPRQPEYGEHLLKYIPSVMYSNRLSNPYHAGEFSCDSHNIKLCSKTQKNLLIHELGHAIQQQKMDNAKKRIDDVLSSDEPTTLSSLEDGIDNLLLYHNLDVKHEDAARDLQFRRVPRFEEHVSEYSTPTFDELIAIEEGLK